MVASSSDDAASGTAKAWKLALDTEDAWFRIFEARFPRSKAQWANNIDWGSAGDSWKARIQKLLQSPPVLLWVDDNPSMVEHLQARIKQTSPVSIHHENGTLEAIKWLSSSWLALDPRFKVITDNHRNEKDASGEMHSNYEAGSQLIRWLNGPEGSFSDANIMIFCGQGSLPYVRPLLTEYKNVSISVTEDLILRFALKPPESHESHVAAPPPASSSNHHNHFVDLET